MFELRCAENKKINPLESEEFDTGLTMFLPSNCVGRIHAHPKVCDKECMNFAQVFAQSDELKIKIFNMKFPMELLLSVSDNKKARRAVGAAAMFGSANCVEFTQGDPIALLTIEEVKPVIMKEINV